MRDESKLTFGEWVGTLLFSLAFFVGFVMFGIALGGLGK